MTIPLLKVHDLSFFYNKRAVLQNLHLSVNKGEVLALIGSSGSGKTTLFKLLSGILSTNQGEITIDKTFVSQSHSKIAYLTQEDLLLPWRSILRNMTLSCELGNNPSLNPLLETEALQLLDKMGLSGYAHAFPEQLSGGMRQRVALARALLYKRPILLLDEPFGPLDILLREQMYDLLNQIRLETQLTMLVITHDFRDAAMLADRIVLLAEGNIQREWNNIQSLRNDPQALLNLMTDMKSAMQTYNPN